MEPVAGDFDVLALVEAVELQRRDRAMSTTRLVREIAWVGAGTWMRMCEGQAGCHQVMPFIQWVGRTPESFTMGSEDVVGELLPEPGPRGWRWYWNMPELARAVDLRRERLELSVVEVAGTLGTHPNEVEHLAKTRYGTSIQIAMRAARWLERTAASFMWEHDGRGLPWSGRRV